MRVYNKFSHMYATVLSEGRDSYMVRYDGDNQTYMAQKWLFEVEKVEA